MSHQPAQTLPAHMTKQLAAAQSEAYTLAASRDNLDVEIANLKHQLSGALRLLSPETLECWCADACLLSYHAAFTGWS